MSMNATENLNFIRISSPKPGYFDPTQTADLLKGLHSAQEMFVLESIGTPRGLRFFVRTESGRSGARSHLKSALGSVMAPGRTDPLLLSLGQDVSVRTLHLRDHTALPSARYSENDTMRLWNTVAQGVKGGSGEAFGGTWAVRVVLQPAPADWYAPFAHHFRSDRTPRAGGIASRLGLSGPPDRSAHVDRDLAASKSLGLAFYSEIQVATIYDDNADARRAANAALDRLTEQVINLTGHSTIWRQGATKTVSGRKLHQGRSGHDGLEPWEVGGFPRAQTGDLRSVTAGDGTTVASAPGHPHGDFGGSSSHTPTRPGSDCSHARGTGVRYPDGCCRRTPGGQQLRCRRESRLSR